VHPVPKFHQYTVWKDDLTCRCCVSVFPKWLFTFGRDVIALSDKYSLISGFYKLLAVAIRIGDTLCYFVPDRVAGEKDEDGDVAMAEVSSDSPHYLKG
jgi:hypothetical protein